MKKILFLVLLALAAMQAVAGNIDVATARSRAQAFIDNKAQSGRLMAPAASTNGGLQLIHTERNSTDASQAVYYIFNTSDSYLIVAGDDRAEAVLAYGDTPLDMNDLPSAMRYWLDVYKHQLEYLQARPDMAVEASSRLRAPAREQESVAPLLTALWDQDAPYYNHCPVYEGRYCLTGCPSTSLSMVFYYWKYPAGIDFSVPGYTTSDLRIRLETLPPVTFDWDNMLDRYYRNGYNQQQADAVAWLMRYVGQAEHMDYTPEASGSYGDNILQTVKMFGYDQDAQIVYKSKWWGGPDRYSDQEWADIIQEELYSGRPIVMCAYGTSMGSYSGHAFNIDGYDPRTDMYHINWGWSGSGNADFVLNAFNGGGTIYNVNQQLIIGIEPPATVPTIKTGMKNLKINAIVGQGASTNIKVKGALLTGDITLSLNDPSGAYSIEKTIVNNGQATYGTSVRVNYNPDYSGQHTATITMSSQGADDVVVTLHGTAVLETYIPQLLEASSIDDNTFSIGWNDATPDKNVGSYRLELTPIEFSELRLQQSFAGLDYTGSNAPDMGASMDDITDIPGWSGSKVYCGNGYVRLGSNSAKGWIETPAIDVSDGEGKITVKLRAKTANNEVASIVRVGCGENDTTLNISNEETDYCVLLGCDMASPARIRIGNAVTSKRALIYDVQVLSGNDYSPIDYSQSVYHEGISGKAFTLTGLSPRSYSLRVQAVYTDATVSPWSNSVCLTVDWPRGDVNRDGEISIADVNSVLNVVLSGQGHAQSRAPQDVNGDGEINIADVNAVIDLIMSNH